MTPEKVQHTGDDEQRVAWKQEPDQQSGLAEHDEADPEERERAEPSMRLFGVEPGDERGGTAAREDNKMRTPNVAATPQPLHPRWMRWG